MGAEGGGGSILLHSGNKHNVVSSGSRGKLQLVPSQNLDIN